MTFEATIALSASKACAKAYAENASIPQRHLPARPIDELEEVPFVNLGLCGPHVVRLKSERANDPGRDAGPLLLNPAYDGILRRLALGDRHSGHLHTGDPDRKSSRAKTSNFRH